MASTIAVAVPLAIAIYSGWHQHKNCIGEHYAQPVAENFCAGLRQTLNESCTAMLSVPLVGEQVKLNIGETITPIKFDEFTKETIRETYNACTDLWDGKIDFPTYRMRLSERASVLNLLFAQLPPKLGANRQMMQDALAGQGASSQPTSTASTKKAVEQICQESGSCVPSTPQTENLPSSPPGLKYSDIENLLSAQSESLRKQFAVQVEDHDANVKKYLSDELSALKEQLHNTLTKGSSETNASTHLIAEVAFMTGSFKFSEDDCTGLANIVSGRLTSDSVISVTAYSDYHGQENANLILSQKRAAQVSNCLTKKLALPSERVRTNGAGVLWTITTDTQVARKAAIYVQP